MKNLQNIANTIRGLAMDGIQAANSGHPGLPLGMADVATVLWTKFLKHNPQNPLWVDRDRFVLSAGHGSMLIYSLLHLSGYDLSLDELKKFRQWDSKTAGHPEYGHTGGVEATTGPLGQGCGNAVGMALAEKMLASRFNTAEHKIVDHFTYVIASEGEFMEGISHEVFSMAGNHGLGNLIVFYDENFISIEGDTHITYSDDVEKRMEAYGWHVQQINGHDYDEITSATENARNETNKPSVIICKTTIAYGSPNKAGSHEAHGAPLGEDEITLTKSALGIPQDKFYVSDEVREFFADVNVRNASLEDEWNKRLDNYAKTHPDKMEEWNLYLHGELPTNLEQQIKGFESGTAMATRSASGAVLQDLAQALPFLVGGSADLAPSNNTNLKGFGEVGADSFTGRNLHFGVRETGMGSIINGMQLHGGFRVFGATFLVFADYVRPTTRLAALMNLPVIYVYTHDSFYVGEDGPTHQPVETLMSLRVIPNVTVIRPADANETKSAWVAALQNKSGPTALLLTRQNLPILDRSDLAPASNLEKGAYTIWENADSDHDLIIMASGSEVWISLEAGKKLGESGKKIRVISFPSWELFDQQDDAYKAELLPSACRTRLAVEAGWPTGWEKYVGLEGKIVGVDHFGASAPSGVLAEQYGFTPGNIYQEAQDLLA